MDTLVHLSGDSHPFDLVIDVPNHGAGAIELAVEELPESLHFASDCASSGGSLSTASSIGCGSFSTASCISSMGSIVSSGG